RVSRFVPRKNWVLTGSDDMMLRIFNPTTPLKKNMVHGFEAHSDYLRCIAVHPTQPYALTSSDDMLIKLWDWDKKWQCTQVFEGHTHYVMHIVINPKDNNQFASASLDRTIKVWQLGSPTPNFTLEGHEKGVNTVDYFHGGEKPYLISGADDRLVKIWDYQNKTCVQTLEGHAQNISCVGFHPELPIILTGSEDGTVRVWHANTYRLESTLNYGLERVWSMAMNKGSNNVALGYDEGSMIIKLGREEPAMSMDSNGKIIFAKHSEIQQANLKNMADDDMKDGERLTLAIKDMGSCEIFPQTLCHNPNGRFVVVCGDGEYIIYTAMALRNKSFGSAQEFVWASDSSEYGIRDGSKIKLFKNFKEKKSFKPEYGADGIFGGYLLGVRSAGGLSFYDWDSTEMLRRIEIHPKNIFWADSGELCCISTDDSFFILKYSADNVARALENREEITEDGIEDAFDVQGEIEEIVKTGVWVGDCFIYTNSVNRLNYYVGGEIVTIAHLDRPMYLLGYIPKDSRLYLADKDMNVISYSLLLSVLEYQTAVMRQDFETAKQVKQLEIIIIIIVIIIIIIIIVIVINIIVIVINIIVIIIIVINIIVIVINVIVIVINIIVINVIVINVIVINVIVINIIVIVINIIVIVINIIVIVINIIVIVINIIVIVINIIVIVINIIVIVINIVVIVIILIIINIIMILIVAIVINIFIIIVNINIISFCFLRGTTLSLRKCTVLPTIPRDQRNRVAHFLEKQGFKQQALAVSCDPEHRFDLAINLAEMKIAYEIAVEAESNSERDVFEEMKVAKENGTLDSLI
ncbi:hypothetical protein QZH41_010375, partial [Actinostola sp. cb2023]